MTDDELKRRLTEMIMNAAPEEQELLLNALQEAVLTGGITQATQEAADRLGISVDIFKAMIANGTHAIEDMLPKATTPKGRATTEHDHSKWLSNIREHTIAVNGTTYLVMWGHHINGGFIALPGKGYACEAADSDGFSDIAYNTDKLELAGCPEYLAAIIATYIRNVEAEERG